MLEPTEDAETGARLRFGNNSLDATFGLQAGDSLALLCNFKNGVGSAIGSLANNCLLASLGDGLDADSGSRHVSATAALSRGGGKLGLTAGSGHDTLPPWLMPGVVGQARSISATWASSPRRTSVSQGYVSIAGTVAKARLIPGSGGPGIRRPLEQQDRDRRRRHRRLRRELRRPRDRHPRTAEVPRPWALA